MIKRHNLHVSDIDDNSDIDVNTMLLLNLMFESNSLYKIADYK